MAAGARQQEGLGSSTAAATKGTVGGRWGLALQAGCLPGGGTEGEPGRSRAATGGAGQRGRKSCRGALPGGGRLAAAASPPHPSPTTRPPSSPCLRWRPTDASKLCCCAPPLRALMPAAPHALSTCPSSPTCRLCALVLQGQRHQRGQDCAGDGHQADAQRRVEAGACHAWVDGWVGGWVAEGKRPSG